MKNEICLRKTYEGNEIKFNGIVFTIPKENYSFYYDPRVFCHISYGNCKILVLTRICALEMFIFISAHVAFYYSFAVTSKTTISLGILTHQVQLKVFPHENTFFTHHTILIFTSHSFNLFSPFKNSV